MTRWRLISLSAVAALLVGGWILVSNSQVKYRVDFTSLVKIWGDVVRDTDKIGLTLTRVSDRKEMEFGTELAKQLERSIVPDPKLQKYVSEIGQRLVEQVRRKGIDYKFHVIKNTSINAFALPGGQIYVTTGMLDFATSEAELAAIIAHEINHVDLRHGIERFQYELLTRRILPSDLAAISRLPYFLFRAPYSEQQEREADVAAVIIMANARYHPKYGLSIDDRMAEFIKERTRTRPTHLVEELSASIFQALEEYFKTHPSWPDRVNTIAAALQRNESKWKHEKFYVGRSNHTKRTSWATLPIDDEWRPYIEPPAYGAYLSEKKYSDFKALAVHLSSGLSGLAWDEATPAAAIARAMSNCEKKIKPCKLYAVGDAVVIDMTPHQVDAVISKYSISGQIARAFKAYLLAADFKALVVDPSTGRSAMGAGLTTPANAIEVANGRCAEGGHICELYAVGNVVVRGLPKEQTNAAIEQYRRRIVDGRINELQKAYLDNRTFKDFKALAVDYQSGQSAMSQAQATPSKAIETAIAACTTETMACEVDAIGDTVVRGKTEDERDIIGRIYAIEVIERISKDKLIKYLNKRDFKAFVVDVSRNYSRYSSGHWHPLAALNFALKRCHELGKDCVAAFLGDTFVLDRSAGSLTASIDEYNKTVNWPTDRRNPLREYMNEMVFTDIKAFAAAPGMKNWQRESGYASLSKAIEETVYLCRTKNPLCELYAIGNHIVFGQSDDATKAIVVLYTREVLEKRLEFFRQPSYAHFKAVAGNPDTMEFSVSYGRISAQDAVQDAMQRCSEHRTFCQIFAVGKMIVFGMPKERIDQTVEEYQRNVDASAKILH